MSIATKHGDRGETSVAGGIRISKADLRVEAYGTVDELNAVLGFARSICTNSEIASRVHEIQKALFRLGSVLATSPESQELAAQLSAEDVDRLTDLVHSIEVREGILSDWSLPGAHPESAAFEVARTVCRRAERAIVRLAEAGPAVHPQTIPYINRLSDLIWLFGRQIELETGVDSLFAMSSTRARDGRERGEYDDTLFGIGAGRGLPRHSGETGCAHRLPPQSGQ